MHAQPKELDPDQHGPEACRQERNVKKRRRRQPEQHRREAVKGKEDERVADEIAADVAVPPSPPQRSAVEDGGLGAVDEHGPEAELADDFVQGPAGDEHLLGHVGEAVEGGREHGEEVALELVRHVRGTGRAVAVDVVRRQQHADAAAAEQDAGVLGEVVAHAQEDDGDGDDDDNGPEVEQLRREDVGVAVREHDEVVALHVAEGEGEVWACQLGCYTLVV